LAATERGAVVEVRGRRVILRDPRIEDVEAELRWTTVETAWQAWDAPWEGMAITSPERVEAVRQTKLDKLAHPLPSPRERLSVERIGGPLLGWVTHYRYDPAQRTTWVGINLCESGFWGQGLGTEALCLWIDTLFSQLNLHRVGTETWSGNERMIRCALRCGFVEEGRFRETVEYEGQRWDSVKFGLLRREWEQRRRANSA